MIRTPVSLVDAVLDQHVHDLVGEEHQVAEGEFLLLAFLVHPDHRKFVPVFVRPGIDHIEPEVEEFRHVNAEIPVHVVIIRHVVMVGSDHRAG